MVKLINVQAVTNTKKETVVVARNAKVAVCDERGRERERYNLVYGSVLLVTDGDEVEPEHGAGAMGPVHLRGPHRRSPARSRYDDLIEGENVREETDKLTGHTQKIVIEPLGADRRIPTIVVAPRPAGRGRTERRYQLAIGSHLMVAEGDAVIARRRAGQDPARDDEDQGHHRRSAARRRAVRGAPTRRTPR